ncbi:MAG TPA: hypothetical protein VN033_06995 [Vulgatibacter sp.]|nr:hypothetical protein [Vulgatibacter sp.]
MRSRVPLLAVIAAFGVLLHAGTAAASIWCAMTGLGVSCCCPRGEAPEHDSIAGVSDPCCREALEAPVVDGAGHAPAAAPLPALAPWDEPFQPPRPGACEGRDAPARPPSAPLAALATIVIVR